MASTERLNVTITRPMRVALEDLAYRNAGTVTSEARRLLRQALDRTLQSPNVQMRLAAEGYTAVGPDGEGLRDLAGDGE